MEATLVRGANRRGRSGVGGCSMRGSAPRDRHTTWLSSIRRSKIQESVNQMPTSGLSLCSVTVSSSSFHDNDNNLCTSLGDYTMCTSPDQYGAPFKGTVGSSDLARCVGAQKLPPNRAFGTATLQPFCPKLGLPSSYVVGKGSNPSCSNPIVSWSHPDVLSFGSIGVRDTEGCRY
jgi:hypothetical protein